MASSSDERNDGASEGQGKAPEWTVKDYRDWVHSQIANRMFWKLGTIGTGSIIVLVGAYLTFQHQNLQSAQESIQLAVTNEVEADLKEIEARLQTKMETEVLTQIVDRSALVDHARSQVSSAVNDTIDDLFNREESRRDIAERLMQLLDRTGGTQKVILEEARRRAVDRSKSDSTRALALQLYTLFHEGEFHKGERALGDVKPLREMFVEIFADQTTETAGEFPPKLLEAILEHYPLGEYGARENGSECAEFLDRCKEWDMRVVEEVLSLLHIEQKYPVEKTLFDKFFRRIPPEVAGEVLEWVGNHSTFEIARYIMLAIMHSDKDELVKEVIPHIAVFAADRENPELRQLGLEALATLDPHNPFQRKARIEALASVWRGASDAELYEAFPTGLVRILISTVHGQTPTANRGQHFSDWARNFYTEPPREWSLADFLRLAIIGLLRTEGNGDAEGSSNDPQGVNDWEFALRGLTLTGRQAEQSHLSLHTAWVLRMAVDIAADHDVKWAADKLLSASIPNLLQDRASQMVTRFAVEEGSYQTFVHFANRYVDRWLSQDSSSSSIELASALIQRDARSEKPYDWLKQVLNRDPKPKEELFDHLLDALQEQYTPTGSKDQRARLLNAANRIVTGRSGEFSEQELARILTNEFIRRAELDHGFWDVAAAIEDAISSPSVNDPLHIISLDDSPLLSDLKEVAPWIGTESDTKHKLSTAPGPQSLRVSRDDKMRENGGRWYRIVTEQPVTVTAIDPPEGVELVVTDSKRSNVVGRSRRAPINGSFDVYLAPGTYAVAVRIHETDGSDSEQEVRLRIQEAPYKLTVGQRSQPVMVSDTTEFIFESGSDSGEAWLAVSLEEGAILEVETEIAEEMDEFDDTEDIDLAIMLGLMMLVEPGSNNINMRLFRDFEPELFYQLRGLVSRFDSEFGRLLSLVRDLEPELFHELQLAGVGSLRTIPRRLPRLSRLMMSTAPDLLFRLRRLDADLARISRLIGIAGGTSTVDTYLRLLNRKTLSELASDDDGGQDVNAKLNYEADRAGEVLIQVSRCCTAPFEKGDQFILRVRLHADASDVDSDGVNRQSRPAP